MVPLREFMSVKFAALERRLDELSESVSSKLGEMEKRDTDKEQRLARVERVVWLLTIVGGIAISVITMLLVEMVRRGLGCA